MNVLLTDDIKPIYLGYETKTRKYYFYFIKDKVPRFLEYYNYFFWGIGPQTALVLQPIPAEIEQDLHLFLEGTLSYEFRKIRKNSRTETPVKQYTVYRTPQEVSGEETADSGRVLSPTGRESKDEKAPQGDATNVRRRRRGQLLQSPCSGDGQVRPSAPIDSGVSGSGGPDAIHGHGSIIESKPKRHRRTKAEMIAARALEVKNRKDIK